MQSVPFRMVFIMWVVFFSDFMFRTELYRFGLIPRDFQGLLEILTAPLLHDPNSPLHIVGNTVPLLFLGVLLFFFYNKIALNVFVRCWIVTNVLVWLFARTSIHIGASGLVYGLAAFLIVYGFLRRDILSIAISLVVISLYGYLIYGIFPTNLGTSFESHLAGVVVGVVSAFQLRNVKDLK